MVETRWNGKETTNTARPGDFIVTNLSPQRQPLRDREGHMNVYVIAADKFPALYEPTSETSEHGAIYRAKGVVSALPLPGGFDILAPWGERQTGASGYLLLNGDEVYGSSRDAFEATYEADGEARLRNFCLQLAACILTPNAVLGIQDVLNAIAEVDDDTVITASPAASIALFQGSRS